MHFIKDLTKRILLLFGLRRLVAPYHYSEDGEDAIMASFLSEYDGVKLCRNWLLSGIRGGIRDFMLILARIIPSIFQIHFGFTSGAGGESILTQTRIQ